jgi:ankyrin repeat protein
MRKGFLEYMFSSPSETSPLSPSTANAVAEIAKDYKPTKGAFFRTLEFPETDETGTVTGKVWMEAGLDPATGSWVLWQKSIRKQDDVLVGGTSNVMSARALFEKTTFVNAYDQMTTFELAQKTLGIAPMTNKTPAKLGGDYFRQFAWRENLMMSRSGRLYPIGDEMASAANTFDEEDLVGAKKFLERLKTEQFVPVPLQLPTTDWEKAYQADKTLIDQRLNVLYFKHKDDKNNPDLAMQIVAYERPLVLYAHLKGGWKPKIYEDNAELHFKLVKAAIDRTGVDTLSLLAEAGLSFYVSHNDETPLELVLQQRRYSHLYVMLSRDNAKLANYPDASGNMPAVMAMAQKDQQAFRMLYLEGLDYAHADKDGWKLIHHAFDDGFMPGVYAWLDEGLPIDEPIAGTGLTGVSLARARGNQPLIDFAVEHGANPNAPEVPAAATPVTTPAPVAIPVVPVAAATAAPQDFTLDMLNSAATNAEIEAAAIAYSEAGGSFTMVNDAGLSVFELCWKNQKPKPELDRRALIPVFGRLGADASALLDNGTTVPVKAVSGTTIDLNFIRAIEPFVKNINTPDANGNIILHALQMNASDVVGHSNNVSALLKLFPTLDLNLQNSDGYSNIGLAIRLNRSQTLKLFVPNAASADWSQTTNGGWSLLDLAFTAACGTERVTGAPRATRIVTASDATRTAVLDMLGRAARKDTLTQTFNRQRPDGKTLAATLAEENAPVPVVTRLTSLGMTA